MSPLLIAALISILLAALLAMSDAALSRISRIRVDELVEAGRAGSSALAQVVGDTAAYLSVIAFVRAIAEMTAAVLVTLWVTQRIESFWPALLTAIGVMAVITFVIVGVSPRTLGRQHADRVALVAAPVARWLHRILGPISRLLVIIGNAVTPGRGYRDGPFDNESELRDLVDLAGERALIEADERAMIHSVFELGDTVAREVMVPRTDMVTIDTTKTLRSATNLFLRSGFSRAPVVGEDSDDILGLVYFKDVARRTNADASAGGLAVETVMRPAGFVPESKPIDDLLREMQRDQTHLVMVVDEYGGIAGLVTIEDILEEIVGEIADEYDRETPDIEDLGEGRWRIDAGAHIDDIGELLDADFSDDDVDTMGGLLGKHIGQVPIVGSSCEIDGYRITAEKMAGRRHRVASLIVERLPDEPGDQT